MTARESITDAFFAQQMRRRCPPSKISSNLAAPPLNMEKR